MARTVSVPPNKARRHAELRATARATRSRSDRAALAAFERKYDVVTRSVRNTTHGRERIPAPCLAQYESAQPGVHRVPVVVDAVIAVFSVKLRGWCKAKVRGLADGRTHVGHDGEPRDGDLLVTAVTYRSSSELPFMPRAVPLALTASLENVAAAGLGLFEDPSINITEGALAAALLDSQCPDTEKDAVLAVLQSDPVFSPFTGPV